MSRVTKSVVQGEISQAAKQSAAFGISAVDTVLTPPAIQLVAPFMGGSPLTNISKKIDAESNELGGYYGEGVQVALDAATPTAATPRSLPKSIAREIVDEVDNVESTVKNLARQADDALEPGLGGNVLDDDYIVPEQKWYHGTDSVSGTDIIQNGLNKEKLLARNPVEGVKSPGLFVTDLLSNAVDYTRMRSAEWGLPQPGIILEFDDTDVGRFLKGVGKDYEAVIPFDAFDKIPRPRQCGEN